MIALGQGLAVRAETDADAVFTRALFDADRRPMFASAGWPAAALDGFLASQFALQDAHYRAAFPEADHWIVTDRRAAVGRMIVDRSGARWRLVDILLAEAHQGRGLGTRLVQWLIAEGRGQGATSLDLSVARDNPRAAAFYRRLGFVEAISASATHRAMTHPLS